MECKLRQLIPFDSFALYQKSKETLQCVFAKGEAEAFLSGLSIALGGGVSGWVAANRTPLVNGAAATEFGVAGNVPPGFTLSSALAIPLESEFGTIGVLTLYCRGREAFRPAHLRVLLATTSKLAYQLRLDRSGLARENALAAPQTDLPIAAQLERLSAATSHETGTVKSPATIPR